MEIAQVFIFLRRTFVLTVIAVLPIAYGIMKLNLDQQKQKQHRSMSNIYKIARAIEEYAVEHQTYPQGNSNVSAISIYLRNMARKSPLKMLGVMTFFTNHPMTCNLTQLPVMEMITNLICQVTTKE